MRSPKTVRSKVTGSLAQILVCICCLLSGLSVGITSAVFFSSSQPALAAVGPPGNSPWSFYAIDANTSTAYTLGLKQALDVSESTVRPVDR